MRRQTAADAGGGKDRRGRWTQCTFSRQARLSHGRVMGSRIGATPMARAVSLQQYRYTYMPSSFTRGQPSLDRPHGKHPTRKNQLAYASGSAAASSSAGAAAAQPRQPRQPAAAAAASASAAAAALRRRESLHLELVAGRAGLLGHETSLKLSLLTDTIAEVVELGAAHLGEGKKRGDGSARGGRNENLFARGRSEGFGFFSGGLGELARAGAAVRPRRARRNPGNAG